MKIMVNGESREVRSGLTVRDLIVDLGLADSPVAAEVNQHLVPKRAHGEAALSEGDIVELVTLVGGG